MLLLTLAACEDGFYQRPRSRPGPLTTMGQGLQQSGQQQPRTVNCQSTSVGYTTQTQCR